jgi:hypothetical protein
VNFHQTSIHYDGGMDELLKQGLIDLLEDPPSLSEAPQ